MTLRLKLIILFIVLAVGEGILIGYITYSDSNQIVNSGQKREMSNTINRIDINISDKIMHINHILDSASGNEAVHLACTHPSPAGKHSLKKYTEEFIEAALEYSSEEITLIVYNQASETIFQNKPQSSEDARNSLQHFRSFLTQASEQKEIPQNLFLQHQNDKISIIKGIYLQKELIGGILLELPSDVFSELLLGNRGLFRYQYLFILDKNGELICTNPNVDMAWYSDIYKKFDNGIRRFDLRWNDKSYYVCGQYNGITGWSTYSVIESSNLFTHSKAIGSSIIFTVITVAFFTALMIIIISYSLTKPIHRLSKAMKEVQKGDFHLRISSNKTDEIGKLESAFDYMLDKIELLINQVYKKDIAQKNAELAALQARINPHFLYNTLDGINWMLIERNQNDISELILSLADILRYSIGDSEQMVSINKEIQYADSYMKIQKSRFYDRLNYLIEVDDELSDALVPKLILQPFIENSVKHGIEPSTKPSEIRIVVRKEEDMVKIIISDNGIGMPPSVLSNLIKKCENDRYEYHSHGIGLVNTDRRMKLCFHEDYSLQIESVEQQGTSITIRFPYLKGTTSHENNDC